MWSGVKHGPFFRPSATYTSDEYNAWQAASIACPSTPIGITLTLHNPLLLSYDILRVSIHSRKLSHNILLIKMVYYLWVFGSNGEGQLGEGIPIADIVSKPTALPHQSMFKDIQAIKSGDNHTLLLLNDGSVFGIGDNRVGQLSIKLGSAAQINRFQEIKKDVSLLAATCGTSAFISYREGPCSSIFTTGHGQWGELGSGDKEDMTAFGFSEQRWMDTGLYREPLDFAAGVWHYVVVMMDGSVYGWGKARLGQLGEKLSGKVTKPTKIEAIPFKPVRVVCGKDFTYLIDDPSRGEHMVLGKDKFNIISAMPPDIKGWKDLGATWHAIFVLFDDGRLTAWGKENQWKLLPPELPAIEKIAVGSDHVLAVTRDGKLISWGWGKHGNCGDLSAIKQKVENDMVSGFWSEISIPGQLKNVFAGYCTSFVITDVNEEPGQNIEKDERQLARA